MASLHVHTAPAPVHVGFNFGKVVLVGIRADDGVEPLLVHRRQRGGHIRRAAAAGQRPHAVAAPGNSDGDAARQAVGFSPDTVGAISRWLPLFEIQLGWVMPAAIAFVAGIMLRRFGSSSKQREVNK